MNIQIKTSRAAQVRQLKQKEPGLSEAEIAEITGTPIKQVRAALARRPKDKPKSRLG